jgi:hypothetical protein
MCTKFLFYFITENYSGDCEAINDNDNDNRDYTERHKIVWLFLCNSFGNNMLHINVLCHVDPLLSNGCADEHVFRRSCTAVEKLCILWWSVPRCYKQNKL